MFSYGLFSTIHGRLGHLLYHVRATLVIVVHGGILLRLVVGLDHYLLLVEVRHHVLKVTVLIVDPLEHVVVERWVSGVAHYLFDGVHADVGWLVPVVRVAPHVHQHVDDR